MRSTTSERFRPLGQLASLLALLVLVTAYAQYRSRHEGTPLGPPPGASPEPVAQVVVRPPLVPVSESPAPVKEEAPNEPDPPPAPSPSPPPLDRAAVARAEAELDEASRVRSRAEARAGEASRRLEAAANQAVLDTSRARKLAFRIRDPSARISRMVARGGFLRSDLQKLHAEVTKLRTMPRPKATSILTKSPVARPAWNDEFHFELRRNRICFINLDRLLELARSDAQVRIRMSDRTGVITSQVGPVGSFSLAYALGRASTPIDELIERQSIRFDLKGWEIIPESDNRGETYEATRNPISPYTQVINRLNPARSILTFWVYPDSFTLYRRLRAELIARGFSVAARPLPDGMSIRGSPMGSVSATQ